METTNTQQEQVMQAEPQKEHQWLQKLVGEWTYETEANMGAERPTEKATGTESVRPLGGLWILAEGLGEIPGGGEATTMMTIGYDPQKQRYIGTWVGAMMSYLWLYNGELDADKNALTLTSEGPSMIGEGKIGKYRDIIEIKSDTRRVMTSHFLSDDGQWHQFMTINYQRKK